MAILLPLSDEWLASMMAMTNATVNSPCLVNNGINLINPDN